MNRRSLKVILLVFVCIIIFPFVVQCSDNRYAIIEPDFKQLNLGKYLDILIDNSDQWSIDDVSSSEFQQKFIHSTKDSLVIVPPFQKIVWVRFKLRIDAGGTPALGPLNLELGRARYAVDFFQPSPENSSVFIKKSISKNDPVAIGDHEFRHLTFKIDAIENTVMTCFARFEVNGPEFIPFILRSSDTFRNYTGYDYLGFGMLYGIMLGMILYNFFLFITLKYKIYFQYVLQISFFLLFSIIFMGHMVPVLKLDFSTALLLEYCFLGAYVFCAVIFCRNFFNMNLMSMFWNNFLYFFQIVGVGIIIAGISGMYSLADFLANLSAGLSLFVVLIIATIQWRQGYKPAGFYILANFFFLFSTAIFVLWILDAFPRNIPGEFIFTMGPVVESILLSFSLAYRIRVIEDDRLALAQSKESYKHASQIDGMTGLYNKQYMFDSLTREIDVSNQTNNLLTIIIIDMDNFKKYNDSFGHPEGDVVLKALSYIITSLIRGFDSACRYGGEEFAILLPNTNIEDAFNVAERIRKKFSSKIFHPVKGRDVSLSISSGVALYSQKESLDVFVKRADKALYMAKKNGKNRTQIA